MIRKTDLFISGDGMPCFRIPGLIRTAKGTLIAYCETRSCGDDWDAHGVMMRRCEDGAGFEPPVQLVSLPAHTVNNPVMIAKKDGGVVFLWMTDYETLYEQQSTDDGKTFSSPRKIDVLESYRGEYGWTCAAVGPGHGIQTKNGMLAVPVWLARGGERRHFPSVVSMIRSVDGGKTWLRGDLIDGDGNGFESPNETSVAELTDGALYLTIRNRGENRARYHVLSRDGRMFTAPDANDHVPDPRCFGAACCAGGPLYVASCATSGVRRVLLTARESVDGGKSWPFARLIEGGEAGYADLVAGENGELYCLYERGCAGSADIPLSLTLACFDRAFIEDQAGAERDLYAAARAYAAREMEKAGIVLTENEKQRIEVSDMGLGRLTETGLQLITYVNTARCCAKEMVLFPFQTCPEHRHPTIDGVPGKEETFRCRRGLAYLYVRGEGAPSQKPPRGDEAYYTAKKEIVLHEGEQYTIHPDTPHWFKAGPLGAIISEFSTSSHDETDIFMDPRIKRAPKQV